MDPNMAQFLSPYQSWHLAVKNAIDNDQAIPIPEGSPAMTASERDGWQTHIRQNIHREEPITPYHWLQQQAQRRSAPTTNQIWGDLLAYRQAQAGQGDGAT